MPWRANAADAIVIGLLLFSLWLALYGGSAVHVLGLRISTRSALRPVLWAAIIYGLRHHFVRWQPLPARIALWIRSVLRTPEPRFPDVRVFGEATEAPGVAVRRRRVFAWAAAVVLLYAALTLVMTYPQVRRCWTAGSASDIGDPLLSTWRLAWVAHQLPRDPAAPLRRQHLLSRAQMTLAFSDAMLVPALTAAPLAVAGRPSAAAAT